MDDTTLETLEYPSVLKEIASFTSTPLGREKVLGLRPSPELRLVEGLFGEFSEARDIIKHSGTLPLAGATDIRPILSRIGPEGAYLLQEELLLVRNNLSVNIGLKSLLTQPFSRTYRAISSKIDALSDQRALHSELLRILDDKGQIKDSASAGLFRIRKEIRTSKERARSFLESLTTDKKFKEYLQEDFITIRDDRYVLSIKTGMHTSLSGVIHGRSGSGATYFVEPLQIVELNNRIAILKKEETAEEIDILKRATSMVGAEKDAISADMETIGSLDAVQAKALFAREINATVPSIRHEGEVRLRGARHPLLAIKEAKDSGAPRVVPVDIIIAGGCRVLVISGANTGGKTVALKTLGLLTLMLLSGIPVPVEEGSEAVVFRSIFSDIGDRQDIIASLSTFSAHIKRVKEFLTLAGPGSLVLIDEIGAGTDPSEGCALALAALETFREKGAVTVITTHLNLLKAQAQVDPRYMNASVEFDEKTLKPMYRLHYGVPGPSLGLSIAESLGIPAPLIEKARANLKEKEGAFIESVRMIEEERDEVRRLKERLQALEKAREKAVERLRAEREAILEKAKKKVDAMVAKAKEEIRETIVKLKEEKRAAPPAARAASAVDEIVSRVTPHLASRKTLYMPAEGDRVSITGSSTKGVVLRVDKDEKKAELRVGSLKVWVPWDKLNKRGGGEGKRTAQGLHINADMEVASSVNIIGMRAEEAIAHVTKFLDNAHANGLGTVEIIHGVGTGRLAKAVEEYLRSNEFVKSFYHGDPARGGAGVTIAELT